MLFARLIGPPLWILQIGFVREPVRVSAPVATDLAAVLSRRARSPMTRDVKMRLARSGAYRGKAQYRRLPDQTGKCVETADGERRDFKKSIASTGAFERDIRAWLFKSFTSPWFRKSTACRYGSTPTR